LYASVGRRRRVVPTRVEVRLDRAKSIPVSTMPTVLGMIIVDIPYMMDCSMPQKSLAREVLVTGLLCDKKT
jgi:hypothetical protein